MQPLAPRQPVDTPMSPPLFGAEIMSRLATVLGYIPCKWQLDVGRVLYLRERRIVISTAATGAGKTATFFIPSILEKSVKPATSLICVPLKDLGQQMADQGAALGLSTFNAMSDTLNTKGIMNVRFFKHFPCPICVVLDMCSIAN